jgi:tetratricopeptide (TPR) repeat protein
MTKASHMIFFRRLRGLLAVSRQKNINPQNNALTELLEKARRELYQEDYSQALKDLDEANQLLDKTKENRASFDIAFSRADVLTSLERFEEAETLLQELRKDCEIRQMKAPLAYTLASLGQLAQKQCQWEKAQSYYEAARDIAQGLKTTGAMGRAAAHLADLHLQDGNANYAVYLLEDALPKLDKSGDKELIGYFQGRLGLAHIQIGNREQGQRALLAGLDTAQKLQHRGQMRSLHLFLAQTLAEAGDFRRARQHYLATLGLNPQPLERGKLLCQLSICSLKLQDSASAKQEAEAALEIAKEHNDPSLLAQAQACLGLALEGESALPYLQEAAKAYESFKADSIYIDVLRRLASLQENNTAKASLEKAAALASNMPFAAAQAQSDLARLYQDEKQLKEALTAWQQAAKLYQETSQTGHQARVESEIAAIYEQLGDGRMALREYGHALEHISHLDDAITRGIVLANVAAAYSEFGEIETAQDFFKEAIEIAQRGANPAVEALRRGNYGRFLTLTNRAKQGHVQIQQAKSMSETLGLNTQAAIMRGNEALAFAIQGDYQAATEAFADAVERLAQEPAWQALVLAHWGDMLLEQGKQPAPYQNALEIAKAENLIPVIIQLHLGLANLALLEKRLDDAQAHLSEIDSISKRLYYKRFLALLHQSWSKVYAAQGKTTEAQSAWEEAKKLRSLMRMPPILADWL